MTAGAAAVKAGEPVYTGGFADEALLQKVKDALRITSEYLDGELMDIIDACAADLSIAGVCVSARPIVIRAVILYAKAHFSFSADGKRFHEMYDSLKNVLRLSREFRAENRDV